MRRPLSRVSAREQSARGPLINRRPWCRVLPLPRRFAEAEFIDVRSKHQKRRTQTVTRTLSFNDDDACVCSLEFPYNRHAAAVNGRRSTSQQQHPSRRCANICFVMSSSWPSPPRSRPHARATSHCCVWMWQAATVARRRKGEGAAR